ARRRCRRFRRPPPALGHRIRRSRSPPRQTGRPAPLLRSAGAAPPRGVGTLRRCTLRRRTPAPGPSRAWDSPLATLPLNPSLPGGGPGVYVLVSTITIRTIRKGPLRSAGTLFAPGPEVPAEKSDHPEKSASSLQREEALSPSANSASTNAAESNSRR